MKTSTVIIVVAVALCLLIAIIRGVKSILRNIAQEKERENDDLNL